MLQVQPTTVAHVSSYYATEPDDECARTGNLSFVVVITYWSILSNNKTFFFIHLNTFIYLQMPNIHMSQSQSMSMQQSGMGMGHQGSPMQNGPMQGQGPMHSQGNPMQQNSMMSQNAMQNQNGNVSQHSFPSLHNTSSFTGQTTDFNLDFLDNMPSTDASNLTAQELLNSLDNSFLNDIL